MLNLLRTDIYRLLRSKSYYVCLGIMVLTTLITFGLMFLMTHSDWLSWAASQGMPIGELANDSDFMSAFGDMDILEMFHSTNISGSFLPVVNGVLGALFICVEFEGGFIKNVLSSHKNTWDYILSKITTLSFINLSYLVITYIINVILNFITGNYFVYPQAADTLFYFTTVWMICNGFSALILLVCMITRSKAAGSTAAVCLCSGLIVMLLNAILSLFGLNEIMNYTLYFNISECPMSYQQPSDLKALIMGIIFTLLYTIISGIILPKKDIA